MTNRHRELVDDGTLIGEPYKTCLATLLSFLLNLQIVEVRNCQRLWQVSEGSEIGIIGSPEFSSAAFDALAERVVATDPSVMKDFHI